MPKGMPRAKAKPTSRRMSLVPCYLSGTRNRGASGRGDAVRRPRCHAAMRTIIGEFSAGLRYDESDGGANDSPRLGS